MISSNQVYEFIEEFGLGKLERKEPEQQIREKIIIVAGQYDIGMSWDRSLTGAAIQGRFMFSPVDTAYWISRNVFYRLTRTDYASMMRRSYFPNLVLDGVREEWDRRPDLGG